ncbi:MAG: SET domain-containing protein [Ktedonobacterales bacterium]
MSPRRYLSTSWYDPRVEIRPSKIQGGGMYASAPIVAGETVSVAGGTVMTEAQFHAYLATVSHWNATQIGETLHLVDLVATPEASSGSMNHSCDSNLWLGDEVTLVARRDIAAGEELTLDYALTTVEPTWRLDQPCRCGSALCRHIITGNDWQLPDVQQRYRGHFAPFINDRIRNDRIRA